MDVVCRLMEILAVVIEIGMCFVYVASFLKDVTLKDHRVGVLITILFEILFNDITMRIEVYSICRLIVYFGIVIFTQCLFYRKYYTRIVVMTVNYVLFLVLDDYITVVLMSYLSGAELLYFKAMTLYRIYATIIAKSLLVISVLLIRKKMPELKKLQRRHLFIILGITGTTLLYALYIFEHFMQRNFVLGSETMLFFLLWVMEILLIYSFAAIAESSRKEEKLQLMNLYNQMLQKSLDEEKDSFDLWSGRVHDYKNHVIYMLELLKTKEYQQLENYMQEEAGILNHQSAYVQSGYKGIDVIINSKMVYAQSQGIHLFCNINLPADLLLDEGAMVTILGNLLDNAIQAEQHMREKFIEVNISYKKGNLYIKIVNHKEEEKIDFQTSNKEDSQWHGIGLRSVKHQIKDLQGDFKLIQEKDKVISMVVLYDARVLNVQ